MNKKGFLPQVFGLEIHWFFIGLVLGIVLMIILLILARKGILPLDLCRLVCGKAAAKVAAKAA